MECPFFGARRVAVTFGISRGRARRLMKLAGIEALYPKPRLSQPNVTHRIYPYRLRDVVVERPDQVWCADITYIPMRSGFLYLVAVIDWFSRYVLAWELSSTLDTGFCLTALNGALENGSPLVFNTDQGAQFTSMEFTRVLADRGIQISMDGRGRWMDNVFIERLWRSLKYELIYPGDFSDGHELWNAINGYFEFYNFRRPHQSLGYRVPVAVYRPGTSAAESP
jgi:putative transposase